MANKQSIESYKLGIEMTSKEGVHDFISMLEAVIEDIKGGLEKDTHETTTTTLQWDIDVILNHD